MIVDRLLVGCGLKLSGVGAAMSREHVKLRAVPLWHLCCSDLSPMSARTALRATGGSVAIAGVDASYCRRLLQSLRSGNGSRPISTIVAGDDLPKQIAASVPSVILFDLGPSPDARGLATISALSGLAKTIVLAWTDDDALAIQALKAGAAGFCPRDTPTDLLRRAVQLVEAAVAGGEQLTARERELVNLVAAGAANKDIARRLTISVKTVKTHMTSIFRKLGLSTRLELAVAVGRAAAPQTKVG